MKSQSFVSLLFSGLILLSASVLPHGPSVPQSAVPYGDNPEAGQYAVINGVKLYYEIYGKGDPLILLHGNGGNIAAMKFQIEYFSKFYQVIAMDCRGRGKSELSQEPLTYMQMAQDAASLLDHLHVAPAYLIGRSDGGVIGLLMGIYFPEKMKKIAVFGANLWPGPTACYAHEAEKIHQDRTHAEEMIGKKDTTKNWVLIRQLNRLMEFQPHISTADLKKIKTPVLVMSADRDLIREEHTLFIYRHIPKANLCIFPGETHWITGTNPDLFNRTVMKFFSEPFKGDEIRK
ncbi:MAG: alpha/beta hydrolase [Candidatus Aminicenantales bacterium]|jgi:pimeloyl-ACP methyl ester carboxylesterase